MKTREQIEKEAQEYCCELEDVKQAYVDGAESRQPEIDELVAALSKFVHLHGCEQEGLSSEQPTPQQWFDCVNEAIEILEKYNS